MITTVAWVLVVIVVVALLLYILFGEHGFAVGLSLMTLFMVLAVAGLVGAALGGA